MYFNWQTENRKNYGTISVTYSEEDSGQKGAKTQKEESLHSITAAQIELNEATKGLIYKQTNIHTYIHTYIQTDRVRSQSRDLLN